MDPAPTSEKLLPATRVAPGTPPLELERLALQEQQHPDADALLIQGVIWVLRAYNAVYNEVAGALRPIDLSLSGFNVLQALANTRSGELEPCQLAERLLVSRPSMTGLIDTLEAKSLVVRRRHPGDRRRVLVALTDTARAVLDDHYPDHYAHVRTLFDDFSSDELQQLIVLLRRIRGANPAELQGAAPATEASAS
jgi:DNA-binding MarR family transcriptional regulator